MNAEQIMKLAKGNYREAVGPCRAIYRSMDWVCLNHGQPLERCRVRKMADELEHVKMMLRLTSAREERQEQTIIGLRGNISLLLEKAAIFEHIRENDRGILLRVLRVLRMIKLARTQFSAKTAESVTNEGVNGLVETIEEAFT